MENERVKIAVTGTTGLLGWHAAGRIYAAICDANFNGEVPPFELVCIDRTTFDDGSLAVSLDAVEAVLHFAGVNRGEEDVVERANPDIAVKLVKACDAAGINPHIVYANSTHSVHDTPYGRSKKAAGEILEAFAHQYTDLVLPHIFGECAQPNYNNVTATLINQLWKEEEPEINQNGRVQLLHAGAAAQTAINAVVEGLTGMLAPSGHDISIPSLFDKLRGFHKLYTANIFPEISNPFDLALFNSYRTGGFPDQYPLKLKANCDHRGILVEASKGGNHAQSFVSSTLPGKKRGDHFHLDLVERFLVMQGEAIIRVRRILTDEVVEFHVSGDQPAAIDMPPLHTHNIENLSNKDVVTFFWSHRLFDPGNPDTYADPV